MSTRMLYNGSIQRAHTSGPSAYPNDEIGNIENPVDLGTDEFGGVVGTNRNNAPIFYRTDAEQRAHDMRLVNGLSAHPRGRRRVVIPPRHAVRPRPVAPRQHSGAHHHTLQECRGSYNESACMDGSVVMRPPTRGEEGYFNYHTCMSETNDEVFCTNNKGVVSHGAPPARQTHANQQHGSPPAHPRQDYADYYRCLTDGASAGRDATATSLDCQSRYPHPSNSPQHRPQSQHGSHHTGTLQGHNSSHRRLHLSAVELADQHRRLMAYHQCISNLGTELGAMDEENCAAVSGYARQPYDARSRSSRSGGSVGAPDDSSINAEEAAALNFIGHLRGDDSLAAQGPSIEPALVARAQDIFVEHNRLQAVVAASPGNAEEQANLHDVDEQGAELADQIHASLGGGGTSAIPTWVKVGGGIAAAALLLLVIQQLTGEGR